VQISIQGGAGTVLPGSIWMKKGSGGEMQGIEMVKVRYTTHTFLGLVPKM
jgi:hypothetical protein